MIGIALFAENMLQYLVMWSENLQLHHVLQPPRQLDKHLTKWEN